MPAHPGVVPDINAVRIKRLRAALSTLAGELEKAGAHRTASQIRRLLLNDTYLALLAAIQQHLPHP